MLEVRGWDEHVFRSNYALQRVVAFDSEKFNFPQVDLAKVPKNWFSKVDTEKIFASLTSVPSNLATALFIYTV